MNLNSLSTLSIITVVLVVLVATAEVLVRNVGKPTLISGLSSFWGGAKSQLRARRSYLYFGIVFVAAFVLMLLLRMPGTY